MLVADVGYLEASKLTGIAYDRLRQWAHRYKWNKVPTPHPAIQKANVTVVTKPADAHAEVLRGLERETKLSLARYSAKAGKDAERATLRDSPYVHKLAQTAGIVHNWGDKQNNANAILNVAILTGQDKPEKTVSGTDVTLSD